jgi:DNA polymerase (family 10)
MSILNVEIADRFDEIADALDLQGANPFRIRAYRNAARVLRGYAEEMAELLKRGANLTAIPSIGHEYKSRRQSVPLNRL